MQSQAYSQDTGFRGFVLPSMFHHLFVEVRDGELQWVTTCVQEVPLCLAIFLPPSLVSLCLGVEVVVETLEEQGGRVVSRS